MSRTALTTITLLCVYGAYRIYAAVLNPLLAVEIVASTTATELEGPDLTRNTLQEDIARAHLPDADWAPDASYFWQRSEEAFLFFDQWLLVEDDRQNKVRLSPLAIVWFDVDDPDRAPHVITATSALIEFQSKVELSEQDPGHIIRADLVGVVTITGPDGLKLVGREFTFDEMEARLYSAYPVSFAAGPSAERPEQIRGRANQFELSLVQTDDSPHGDGMPRIGGLSRILLRRDVHVELTFEDEGRLTNMTVDSDGQFSYAVKDRVASFEDNVRVVRPTHGAGEPEALDRLDCERVSLAFVDKDGETRAGTLDLDLRLQQLWAVGHRVRLRSDEHDLRAEMQELRYDLDARTIMMLDHEKVTVAHEDDVLQCPSIRLVHDEDSQLREAECLDLGQVLHHNPDTGEVEFQLDWEQSMHLQPDPETGWDLLVLEGQARALQPARQTGTAANIIRVWIDRAAAAQQFRPGQDPLVDTGGARPLPVKRIVAEQNVAMVSPSVHIETGRLTADILPATSPPAAMPAGSGDRPASPFVGGTDPAEEGQEPVLIAADTIVARITHDAATGEFDLAQADATKNVRLRRLVAGTSTTAASTESLAQPGSFAVQADRLLLTNESGHVLRLLGAPARIRLAEGEIEGQDILFVRSENRAEVLGSGALTILVPQDLEGNQLEVPQPLTVQWKEGMRFDGQRADFLADVRTRLGTSLMRCEEMVLLLTRRLSFTGDSPAAEDVQIEAVHCRKTVEAQYVTWEGASTLAGIRKAEVAEFSTNLQTGSVFAQGPGWIADWRRGRSLQVNLTPNASAQANEPASSRKFDWEYVRVDFAGHLEGNHRERYATLHDRVQVMYGPVSDPNMTVNRDRVFSTETDQSRDSVWLGSDQLRVSIVPAVEPEGRDTLEVVASGSAELEGQQFRARANSISFDESKELFTLKGRGHDASIWHWSKPGAEPAQATARTIQAIPSKRQLFLDGTRRIWGVH